VTSGPPAAWYTDPGGSGGLRYWDGNAWTEHVTAPPGRAGGYGSITPAPQAPGRRLWPWFVVIGVLFAVAVIVGIVMAVPRIVDAGGRATDEAAQSSAHLAADTGAEIYALEGSYLGATPERLEDRESGLSFTDGPSTDFTTASVLAGEGRFVVAVASLTNHCFVVILEDEIGGPRTTGRLPEGLPCWASLVNEHPLEPVEGF
jgi:hypothetical protein